MAAPSVLLTLGALYSDFATAPPPRQESGPWRSHVAPSLLPFVFICYADLFQLWVPDPVPHHPRVTPVLQRPVLGTCSSLLSLAPLPVSSTCKTSSPALSSDTSQICIFSLALFPKPWTHLPGNFCFNIFSWSSSSYCGPSAPFSIPLPS